MKLPRYVNGFIDRHGRPRYYFRRPGFKRATLPGVPWSEEFMAAYDVALGGKPASIGADKVLPGSMRAVAIGYYGSAAFTRLEPSSRQQRRNIIERFLFDGQNGDKRAAQLQPDHVRRFMEERRDVPESANALRKALRALMQHAIAMKIRADDPTVAAKPYAPTKTGFHTWTEAEISRFEARHPVGTPARLALALGLYTGQAKVDVIAMGPQHIRDEVLSWVRSKTSRSTGIELFIPIAPALRRIINASPSGHLTFLVTTHGKPYTAGRFGHWFRIRCDEAGLPLCSFHGLRKAAARRLAEAGCTPHEIAAITGHATLKEVERYTKAASRKHLAAAAMDKVRTSTDNPGFQFGNKGRKT